MHICMYRRIVTIDIMLTNAAVAAAVAVIAVATNPCRSLIEPLKGTPFTGPLQGILLKSLRPLYEALDPSFSLREGRSGPKRFRMKNLHRGWNSAGFRV